VIHEYLLVARVFGTHRLGLPGEKVELRTFGNGQRYGRFMLKPRTGSGPSLQARMVAVTLADQAGRVFAASQVTLAER
jgi:hypothetical protein